MDALGDDDDHRCLPSRETRAPRLGQRHGDLVVRPAIQADAGRILAIAQFADPVLRPSAESVAADVERGDVVRVGRGHVYVLDDGGHVVAFATMDSVLGTLGIVVRERAGLGDGVRLAAILVEHTLSSDSIETIRAEPASTEGTVLVRKLGFVGKSVCRCSWYRASDAVWRRWFA